MTTAIEMKNRILFGNYWRECECGRTMHADYLATHDDDEYDEIPYTISVSTILNDVYCSRHCRDKAEKKERQIEHRRRRTIGRAVSVLGPSINIKDASGQSRSGWCKCDLETMRTDFPGYVEFRWPGGQYSACGCPWCGQWGVANCDTEAWHKWRSERMDKSAARSAKLGAWANTKGME